MKKLIRYLINEYLDKFHNYNIHMDISRAAHNLYIEFDPPFLLRTMYSKSRIDAIVKARLERYYMDNVTHVKRVYYINRRTGKTDVFKSTFNNI